MYSTLALHVDIRDPVLDKIGEMLKIHDATDRT